MKTNEEERKKVREGEEKRREGESKTKRRKRTLTSSS